MNILYIAPIRQSDGWGLASCEYARALSEIGNLTIRPIYMSNNIREIPEDLLEYEYTKYNTYDITIQNSLPHLLNYNSNFGKQIALVHIESGNHTKNSWASRLEMMDQIIVSSEYSKNCLLESNITTPINIIPIPCDTKIFEQSYNKLDLPNNHFSFYTIGNFIKRKNFGDLLLGFHLAFHPSQNVNLVIKVNQSNIDPAKLFEIVKQFCENTRKKMRLYPSVNNYKGEIIISNYMTDQDILRLHSTCQCFVSVSHGESFLQPAFTAMGLGNTPIILDNTGPRDYIADDGPDNFLAETGWLVKSYKTPAVDENPPLMDLYTSNETWRSPDIYDLQRCFQEAYSYDRKKDPAGLITNGRERVFEYSYNCVAKKIKEIL